MLPESTPQGPACPLARQAQGHPAARATPQDAAEPGRLHELLAAAPADGAAAAAAALMMAAAAAPEGPIAWLRPEAADRRLGRPYGPGLAQLGLAPDRLLLGLLPNDMAILKAGADLLRSGVARAVLLELHGPCRSLDLTASRRLALAAAAGKATAFLLRVGAEQQPTAAWRRWSVASAASRPLEARAPGAPAFAFELLRNRSGPAGSRHAVEWRAGRLAAPTTPSVPESADVASLARLPLSLPAGGSLPAGRRAA
jgi:protein ImuA